MQLQRRVGSARLEEQHRDRGILAQARRERGAGGARADDDVVRLERDGGSRAAHARNACVSVPMSFDPVAGASGTA